MVIGKTVVSLLTIATGVCIQKKAAGPKCRPAASMAEKRGDGGPPDGHDPEARPSSAPFLANSSEWSSSWSWCIAVQNRFSNRHATSDAASLFTQES